MKVIRADAMGLCFGVRDALAAAREISSPEQVTIHGELVHNEIVLMQLAARGFTMLSEQNRQVPPPTVDVLVTAHGISSAERQRLVDAGKNLIDTTCPLVRRVHEAAQNLMCEGRHVLVIGKISHVEVRGIVEDLSSFDVIESPSDVRCYVSERLGVVCQTTTPPGLAERIRREIIEQNSHADIRWVDTICQPTRDRQRAVEQLLDAVDAMVVVGGSRSNNTKQLVERCREKGIPVCHIQSAADLDPAWFRGVETVGLTAGTSTLDETIDEVHRRLIALSGLSEAPQSSVLPANPSDPDPPVHARTSAQWCDYFQQNQVKDYGIPWHLGAELSDAERLTVSASIQTFQLGETGTGRHFRKLAADQGARNGDPHYVEAVERFIGEEHRHADWLGRYLDVAGIPRITNNWTDRTFRRLRHMAGLDLMIRALLTAELMALVYYKALKFATNCDLLRTICQHILKDEVAHVRFQTERLAQLRRGRSSWKLFAARLLDRMLFGGTSLVVWGTHRRVLRAGGFGVSEFLRSAWKEFAIAERRIRGRPAGREFSKLVAAQKKSPAT